ncbi:DUF1778 domain-containing protein [Actinocorallia longicatena]|uniref:DUF1778 domain-containing protein n=1 Tax=Actinocorallia longicatena TaxID=111803 RepID=A0ABP6PYX4_9ACTN
MSVSAHQDLPSERRDDDLGFRTTEEEANIIRKAAELQGWTVGQYILCAVLDRAERDIYTDAALRSDWDEVYPTSSEPLTSMLGALSTD